MEWIDIWNQPNVFFYIQQIRSFSSLSFHFIKAIRAKSIVGVCTNEKKKRLECMTASIPIYVFTHVEWTEKKLRKSFVNRFEERVDIINISYYVCYIPVLNVEVETLSEKKMCEKIEFSFSSLSVHSIYCVVISVRLIPTKYCKAILTQHRIHSTTTLRYSSICDWGPNSSTSQKI